MPDALNHSALCQDVGQRVLVTFPSSPSLIGTLLERPAQGQSPNPAVPKSLTQLLDWWGQSNVCVH